jgi:hypothetical protein
MIKVDGKIEEVPPNGHSVTNVREFKIKDKNYVAVIFHYQSGSYSSTTTRIFEEVSNSFDSSLPIFDKPLKNNPKEEGKTE